MASGKLILLGGLVYCGAMGEWKEVSGWHSLPASGGWTCGVLLSWVGGRVPKVGWVGGSTINSHAICQNAEVLRHY